MKNILFSCVCALAIATPAPAINIGWVSFHASDNMPTTNAANAGFTTAPDKGYTDLLTSNGHTVTRFQSHDTPTAADLATLNTFDLIIISRSVASAHYQAADETLFWNQTLTKPLISLNGYASRGGTGGGSRLGLYSGETIPDTAGAIRLNVAVPSHPIFAGVALDGTNTMVNNYADRVNASFLNAPNNVLQRGISVVTNPIAAGGQVLATVGTAGDPTNGGTVIAEFTPGTTTAGITPNTLGGRRLILLTGSRENDGLTSEGAGIYDLAPDGAKLFLNAVCHMAVCGPPLVAGDTNGNGIGGEFPADFDPIRNNFYKNVTSRAQGDLVLNGRVDFDDFRQWKAAHLGMGGSLEGLDLSFGPNVPEPSSAGLLLMAMILGSMQCRRSGLR
jgi:hypothetical protein